MYISTSLSLGVILSLKLVGVSSAPAPAPAPAPADEPDPAVQIITKNIDCVAFDTPYSCETFCFATFCLGYPDTLSHETDEKAQDNNRQASGANLQPFNDEGLSMYGTTRENDQATRADEYPLASSLEGGLGTQGQGRAIIHGATAPDQQGQSNWSQKLWTNPSIPQAAKIKINLTNWVKELSPYCEAMRQNDKSVCKNPNSFFYRRRDTNDGPNGAASFDRVGT